MESESKLKESLIECDREKEEVEMKCAVLQREKAEQGRTTRYNTYTDGFVQLFLCHCFLKHLHV